MPRHSRSWTIRLLSLLALLSPAACAGDGSAAPPVTVSGLEVARYMGRWHEVARYPNRFERQCVGDASAEYRLLADGDIEVTNSCRVADGGVERAVGLARPATQGGDPARLKVRFAPAWLAWLPMVWGDYWVLDLDAGYQLAAVGDPARQYLWILARRPDPDPLALAALKERLAVQGFDPARLVAGAR